MVNLTIRSGAFFAQVQVTGKESESHEALVDTEASLTHVEDRECVRLGPALEGGREIACIHGDRKEAPVYGGSITVAERQVPSVLIAGLLQSITYVGEQLKALRGRNVLRHDIARLDGPHGRGELN